MPTEIPLERPAGSSLIEVSTFLDQDQVLLVLAWSERANDDDGAWFVDVRDERERPIITGVKLVLGVNLCRRSTHPIFLRNVLRLFDTSRSHREPTIDDLGKRVVLLNFTIAELYP